MSSLPLSVARAESNRPKVIGDYRNNPGILALQPAVQHYAWGDPNFIAALLGEENSEGKPYAELWMGAHPDAPSRAVLGSSVVALNQLLEAAAEEILHPAVVAEFGRELPFLFKVLSAASPLSLQTHPTKRNAKEGFERENKLGLALNAANRNYRDANHKPELIVALTDFYGMRGFRPLSDIQRQIESVPELRAAARNYTPAAESLRALYEELMTLPAERVDAVLTPLVERLMAENGVRPFTRADREFWLLRADRAYSRPGHRDPGLFSFYLLNLVHLRSGEGMYLPAGDRK